MRAEGNRATQYQEVRPIASVLTISAAEQTERSYYEHSRRLAVSFIFILPLLAAYEVGLLVVRPQTVSLAGSIVRWLLHGAFGPNGALVFNLVVMIAIVAALISTHKTGGVRLKILPLVLAESLMYGFLITQLLPLINDYLLTLAAGERAGGLADDIVLSIGAGVYEEIVFRLGLMSAVYFIVLRLSHRNWLAVILAVFVSSIVFAASHYVNGTTGLSGGELARSFRYRAIGGIVFAGLYIHRGLAVACYSHAFYDILVFTSRALG